MVATRQFGWRHLGTDILPLLLASTAVPAVASIVDNGKVTVFNGINYYVGGVPVSKLEGVPENEFNAAVTPDVDIVPLTIIQTNETAFTKEILESTISNYKASDDVFQDGFLDTIYVSYDGPGKGTLDTQSANGTFEAENNKLLIASPNVHSLHGPLVKGGLRKDIPKGPYFVSAKTGDIFKAFRLYKDHQLAFTEAALSDEKGGFIPLPAVTEGAMTKSVAVPSRLYYTPTKEEPLAGLRLGVKDIYDLKGLRASGGNRAYYDLYPARNATGPALQRLIDLGAVIVGKMGTVQFANGDNPTADWVDFHCPFNPRGDGYQAPGGSSSGPGAGIASYDWLDIAVGSDTGGSMRDPSGKQGLFGNRPSVGAVSMDNVIPLTPVVDTAGVFARDAETWSKVVHVWYQNFRSNYTYPKKLFYPNAPFPSADTNAGVLLENLVTKIEDFLGTKRTYVDVNSQWNKTHATGTPDTLTELQNTTYAFLTFVGQYRLLAEPFYADYAAQHNGRRPFVNPGPLARWTWGQQNGGDAAYDVAVKNRTIFKNWWESENGYGTANEETCSEGIYIYPYSIGETQYRNVYFGAPTSPPMGFSDGRIASMAGTPDFVVPVGEVPYNSTVSLKTEYMPGARRGWNSKAGEYRAKDASLNRENAAL
ncbi:hypothetical protein PVAR5_0912 [Paecilomyces variotii No. 5]|uniref:Uncharacterized protein n=1 Tax=Byssochlamys spectabilis (strain No. 5 / NBRC 109023) TaxID=1356009 RepID=V5FRP1_BYSSN|nr:hypothetical protein PVAR5_0912 [Paecilomyces variotii No. 5]